jgi:hypothetical protein
VKSPNALAQPFVQEMIFTKKSALSEPQCNMNGTGQLNMLLSIDAGQQLLTIGGGVPQALVGEPKAGTCWASFFDSSSGMNVAPATAPFTQDANGKLTAVFASFTLPIYLEDATTPDSYFLLPLHEVTVHATLSTDKNCIGRYAAEALDPAFSCLPAQGSFAWHAGGGYEGYVTVEEADEVMIASLGSSLCVVLSGDPALWKGPNNDCKSSPAFQTTGGLPKGDWCSASGPGGCADAWHVSIDIAAQAIALNGEYDDASGTCSL